MIHIIDSIDIDLQYTDVYWRKFVPQLLEDHGYAINVISGNRLRTFEDYRHGEIVYRNTQLTNLFDQLFGGAISSGDIIIVGHSWAWAIIVMKYYLTLENIDVKFIVYWVGSVWDKHSKIRFSLVKPGTNRRWAHSFERTMYQIADYCCFLTADQCKRFLMNSQLKQRKYRVTGLPLDWGMRKNREEYSPVKKEDVIVLPHDAYDPKQREIFYAIQSHMSEYEFVDAYKLELREHEYYRTLNRAKMIMAVNLAESNVAQIYEGMLFGCIPMVPDEFVYPEVFSEQYLYPSQYIKPPTLNFVRGRRGMQDKVDTVMLNYNKYMSQLEEDIEEIRNKHFNSNHLINIIKNEIKYES